MKKNILQFIVVLLMSLHLNAQDWNQVGTEISADANGDVFGSVVSLNDVGNIMAAGFPKMNGTGMVNVYSFENDEWTAMGNPIVGEVVGEDFGWSVSLSTDGQTLAVGAPDHNGSGSNAGFARIFEWSGSDWTQKGTTLDGINSDDFFGYEVDVSSDGNTVIVGAPLYDGANFNSGAIFIYEWDGTDWAQKGVPPAGGDEYEEFGQTVGMSSDGNTIVVGSPYSFSGYYAGKTNVYEWSSGAWFPKGNSIVGLSSADHDGTSVEISGDGNTIAIGAFNGDDGTTFNAGRVRVFDWDGTDWMQRGNNVYGSASYDLSSIGMSLSSDGNTIAVGAPWNDGNGDKSGEVNVYQWNNSEWVKTGASLYGSSSGEQMGRAVVVNGDGSFLVAAAPYTSNQMAVVRTYELAGMSALNEFDDKSLVTVSPNPTQGHLQISLEKEFPELTIQIYNSIGQLQQSMEVEQTNFVKLELSGPSGFYFIHLNTKAGGSSVLKVLKE